MKSKELVVYKPKPNNQYSHYAGNLVCSRPRANSKLIQGTTPCTVEQIIDAIAVILFFASIPVILALGW